MVERGLGVRVSHPPSVDELADAISTVLETTLYAERAPQLATILATPCTAPFLGVALGFAFTQPAHIIVLVFLTVGIGLAAGAAAIFAATRLIASFLFGVTPRDPATLALSAGTLAAVALLAGYVPARRASRVDPMTALRDE